MLTYTYHCAVCEKTWEERQRISEPVLTNCSTPGCAGVPRRIIQPSTFVLKGKGWYKDGY